MGKKTLCLFLLNKETEDRVVKDLGKLQNRSLVIGFCLPAYTIWTQNFGLNPVSMAGPWVRNLSVPCKIE